MWSLVPSALMICSTPFGSVFDNVTYIKLQFSSPITSRNNFSIVMTDYFTKESG